MMNRLRKIKALTLVELLVALSFLGIILLAATMYHLHAIRIFNLMRGRAQNTNIAGNIMEHIARNIRRAYEAGIEDDQRAFYVLGDTMPDASFSGLVGERLIIRYYDPATPEEDYCWYIVSNGHVRYAPVTRTALVDTIDLGEVNGAWFKRYDDSIADTPAASRNMVTVTIDVGDDEELENPRTVTQSSFVVVQMCAQKSD